MWELPTGYNPFITVDVQIPRDLIPFMSGLLNELPGKFRSETDREQVYQAILKIKEDMVNDT